MVVGGIRVFMGAYPTSSWSCVLIFGCVGTCVDFWLDVRWGKFLRLRNKNLVYRYVGMYVLWGVSV